MSVSTDGVQIATFAYDGTQRRIRKETPAGASDFFYDGWNMVEERLAGGAAQVTNGYVWGLDLSGTMQGAGGIGGLVARCSLAGDSPAFYCADANGNVTALFADDGTNVARYVYDPYGTVVNRSGALADENVYRFSTKYTDDETGLVYYGYRYYAPDLGRWLNRDPIDDDGWGLAYSVGRLQQIPYRELSSLYIFTGNSPCRTSDYLGLLSMQTIDGPSDVVPWWKGGIRRCRGCGDFWWKVRFTTDGSEITGYLIQEVSVVYQVKTCAGAIPSGYPVNMTFYEAYEIKDGGDAEDIWWDAEGPRCCTKGIKTVGAKIAFFWIGTLPSTFVPNNPLCPTDAPCTTTRPWFFGLTRPWISNYINRTMTKWWKCCPTQYCGITASPLQAP
jgi:RHS repeat-associated protein